MSAVEQGHAAGDDDSGCYGQQHPPDDWSDCSDTVPASRMAGGRAPAPRPGGRHCRARAVAGDRRVRLVASATTLTAARSAAGRHQPRTGARRRRRWLLRVGPGLRSDHVRRNSSRGCPSASHVRDAPSRAGGHRVPRAAARATPRLAPRDLRGSRRGGAVVPPGRLDADRTHPACARAGGGRSHDPVDGLPRALRRVAARGGPRAPLSLVFTGITILAATPAEEARRPDSAGEHHDHSKADRVTHRQRSRAGSRRDLRGPVVPARSPGSDGDNVRRTHSTGAGRRAPAARCASRVSASCDRTEGRGRCPGRDDAQRTGGSLGRAGAERPRGVAEGHSGIRAPVALLAGGAGFDGHTGHAAIPRTSRRLRGGEEGGARGVTSRCASSSPESSPSIA